MSVAATRREGDGTSAEKPRATRRAPALVKLALVFVLLCAAVARALPLLVSNGAVGTAGFDEGVYLSAAGLFSEGVVPYRDFIFIHPPGLSVLLWPLNALAPGALGWDDVLAVARWLSVLVGMVNVVLVALIARRWRGWPAALVAGAVYAAFWPAYQSEGHVLLEPFVNLAALISAVLWLPRGESPRAPRSFAAGVAAGVAVLVKLTGGIALVALLLTDPPRIAWRARAWATAGAVVIGVLVMVPFAIASSPGRLAHLIVAAQFNRPGADATGGSVFGIPERFGDALGFGFWGGNRAIALGVVAALPVAAAMWWAWARGGRTGRYFAALFLLVLVAILLAPDFYRQYPAPLGPALAIVLGGAVSALADSSLVRTRLRGVLDGRETVAAAALAVLVALAAPVWSLAHRPSGSPAFAAAERAAIKDSCVYADPPVLRLAANQLPATDATGTPLVDPFGGLLVVASDAGAGGTTADELHSAPAQARLRKAVEHCPYVALATTPVGDDRWGPSTATWFEAHYKRVAGEPAGPALWRRTAP